MILGVIIGQYAPQVKDVLDTVKFYGVSARTPIRFLSNETLGLLVSRIQPLPSASLS